MRAPPAPPETLSAERARLNDDMAREIDAHLKGFVSRRADGALVGPFAPMIRFDRFGRPAWDFVAALIENAKLPKSVREVAILATGAKLNSRYELYAHERVAKGVGLSAGKIAAIAAGQRPADLTDEEAAAFDVAAALAGGRLLPESTYQRALALFGEDGVAELVFLIGGYCLVSVVLNAFDVSVPGSEEGLPSADPA